MEVPRCTRSVPPTPSELVGVSLLLGLRFAHTLPSVDAVGGQGCGAANRTLLPWPARVASALDLLGLGPRPSSMSSFDTGSGVAIPPLVVEIVGA